MLNLAAAVAALALGANTPCNAAPVHTGPYPGGAPGLGQLPWLRGAPANLGLVGLLWYWPRAWTDAGFTTARIYTGGLTPGHPEGLSMKILWAFLSPTAKHRYSGGHLVIQGRRLDAPGKTWQRFVPIGYAGQNGAPSFASIVDLPSAGCWQVRLSAGGLHATVVFLAVSI